MIGHDLYDILKTFDRSKYNTLRKYNDAVKKYRMKIINELYNYIMDIYNLSKGLPDNLNFFHDTPFLTNTQYAFEESKKLFEEKLDFYLKNLVKITTKCYGVGNHHDFYGRPDINDYNFNVSVVLFLFPEKMMFGFERKITKETTKVIVHEEDKLMFIKYLKEGKLNERFKLLLGKKDEILNTSIIFDYFQFIKDFYHPLKNNSDDVLDVVCPKFEASYVSEDDLPSVV